LKCILTIKLYISRFEYYNYILAHSFQITTMAPSPFTIECDGNVPDELELDVNAGKNEEKAPPIELVWRNVLWYIALHTGAIYGITLLPKIHILTWFWCAFVHCLSCLGITAGVHRLWAHRTYKAKLPLRIILAALNSLSAQNDIIEWARDHRVHHKYSETHADPHNAKRGFFFSHAGWLMVRKHPAVKEKGKLLDLSDLYSDPVCQWQRKLFMPSVITMCFLFPMVVPWYFWGESAWDSFWVCAIARYAFSLNMIWFVNSWAHMYGNRPYDKTMHPSENLLVTILSCGEGFHNYHHAFPQDYSASELPYLFNISTWVIDCFAKIGWAYDMKRMSKEYVDRRKQKTGDGTPMGFYFTPVRSHES